MTSESQNEVPYTPLKENLTLFELADAQTSTVNVQNHDS